MSNGPYEIEQWYDKKTDRVYLKVRKWIEGTNKKIGIIISLSDNDLDVVSEAAHYRVTRLKQKMIKPNPPPRYDDVYFEGLGELEKEWFE